MRMIKTSDNFVAGIPGSQMSAGPDWCPGCQGRGTAAIPGSWSSPSRMMMAPNCYAEEILNIRKLGPS